ncbi:endo alpha-1,4 polygalactosaminidase [Flavobacterium sp. MFBS3-15]|uniref:endo alpha-1,4 polygalactosaminidase n=1 Tax=Flavobacterium sp. MFBS3-15 TaxID=2989816 RepID=UPI0022365825|nr:endo alpha-1,4 polygalactosaminidase [Flavobacterium sp. MFBS3-15]MCW4467572.1 endo alpha-1,4 polygalactosaminidase [Flavobacterium sp. MFBS3-15]
MKTFLSGLLLLVLAGCGSDDSGNGNNNESRDYKQDMRDFVIGISQAAKAVNPNFAVIPQNGIELVTLTGEQGGAPATAYLNAIDGNGQEDLFYGYDDDNVATPAGATSYLRSFLDVSKNAGKKILVTDYCWSAAKVADSYTKNENAGYISYAAEDRNLALIPDSAPHNENAGVITSLAQAKNHIFFINPENFNTKQQFINAVRATNYDVVIMDLFLDDGAFTAAEVEQLRYKSNGGRRLVICYMSIGEAEDYRYYWQNSWDSNRPSWIAAENPDWPGNYKVKYWNAEWQALIYGQSDSYLTKITDAGFDGVYLDIIDAFEYFE